MLPTIYVSLIYLLIASGASGLYSGMTYLCAKAVAELPSDALFAGLFALVLKWRCGLRLPLPQLVSVYSLIVPYIVTILYFTIYIILYYVILYYIILYYIILYYIILYYIILFKTLECCEAVVCAALGLAIGAAIPNAERAMTAGIPIMPLGAK